MALSDVVTLGQYIPGNSLLHRLDPRTKFLAATALTILLFFVTKVTGYLFFLVILLAVVTASGIPLRFLLRGLRPILFLILFTFIVQALFSQEGNIILQWGFLVIRDEGLWKAFFMSFRLTLLVLVTTLLTLVTSPIDLTDGLDRLFSFLHVFRIPVHEIAMMMTIALRFIPTLLDETDTIVKAQISRGAPLDRGNIFRRLRGFVAVLIPLFVSAFRRADELAQAMEARCYRGGEGRTRMRAMVLHWTDLWAALSALALGLAALAFNWLAVP
ncbi:MAG: energy-coupling factor transporter transmembrane protein EcfT [bacterium]